MRQALRGSHFDELSISIAPVVLGARKLLFEGPDIPLGLDPSRVL
jgi:dihydrofolate reductase